MNEQYYLLCIIIFISRDKISEHALIAQKQYSLRLTELQEGIRQPTPLPTTTTQSQIAASRSGARSLRRKADDSRLALTRGRCFCVILRAGTEMTGEGEASPEFFHLAAVVVGLPSQPQRPD